MLQGAGGSRDSLRLHSWLMPAEPRAKNASKVSGVTGVFGVLTLSFKRSYRCLWLMDCPCPPDHTAVTGHHWYPPQRQDLGATLQGFGLKTQQEHNTPAKGGAAPGRAVRHAVRAKEREIPPRYPIKTPFVGLIWSQSLLQTCIQPQSQKNKWCWFD